jgi:hypothetical protein
MTTVFLELDLHTPDVRSTSGGGWIVPKTYSKDENGNVRLTPHCAGLGEIEWHINRMQADLEELRRKARSQFGDFEGMKPKPPFPSN